MVSSFGNDPCGNGGCGGKVSDSVNCDCGLGFENEGTVLIKMAKGGRRRW